MKMIPTFEGVEAYMWLINVEQYLSAMGTPEAEKIPAAAKAFRGCVFSWWLRWIWHNTSATWWTFMKAMIKRFQSEYGMDQPVSVWKEELEQL